MPDLMTSLQFFDAHAGIGLALVLLIVFAGIIVDFKLSGTVLRSIVALAWSEVLGFLKLKSLTE